MNVTVLKLQELTKKQIEGLAEFLKDAIHTQKSEWVCQGHPRLGAFDAEYLTMLQNQSELSAVPSLNVDRWIGVEKDKKSVGICCCSRGAPDRTITLFLVDPKLSPAEQLEVADTIALRGIEDVLVDDYGKRDFISYLPNSGPAAVYADMCGLKVVESGPIISKRQVGIKELRDNILERQ